MKETSLPLVQLKAIIDKPPAKAKEVGRQGGEAGRQPLFQKVLQDGWNFSIERFKGLWYIDSNNTILLTVCRVMIIMLFIISKGRICGSFQ